jgi:hypothetical protein
MKKIIVTVILISILAVSSVYSAEIAWMYIQHRVYGEGKSLNRLGFGLIDDELQYLTQ